MNGGCCVPSYCELWTSVCRESGRCLTRAPPLFNSAGLCGVRTPIHPVKDCQQKRHVTRAHMDMESRIWCVMLMV